MSDRADVTAIVVTWNRPELLRRCLRSLLGAGMDAALRLEVFVVDNGSTAGDAEVVEREFPGVHLIRSAENLGFARANNLALARASGRFALLVNNDVRVTPNLIADLSRYLEAHPEVAVVGPRLVLPNGRVQRSWNRFLTPARAVLAALNAEWMLNRLRRGRGPHVASAATAVDWVSGACFMIRRSVVSQIGPMDPRYFFYAEEMDWCLRAHRAGWEVHYVPGISARHDHAATARSAPRWYERMLQEGRHLFLRKHYGRLAGAMFRLSVFLGAIPVSLCRAVGSRASRDHQRLGEAVERLRWAIRPGPPPRGD